MFSGLARSATAPLPMALKASLVGANNVYGLFKASPNNLSSPGVFNNPAKVDKVGFFARADINELPELNILLDPPHCTVLNVIRQEITSKFNENFFTRRSFL